MKNAAAATRARTIACAGIVAALAMTAACSSSGGTLAADGGGDGRGLQDGGADTVVGDGAVASDAAATTDGGTLLGGDGTDAGRDSGVSDAGASAGDASVDCRGVPAGSAVEDMCGTCDADPANDCVQDCAGSWGGSAREDMCGICDRDPNNDCVQDCAGSWGGSATRDMCGTCDADPANDCVQDCAGTWGGGASVDMCGTCDDEPANDCVQDCAGTWGGPARLDCLGACAGAARVDACGTCDANPDNDCGEGFVLDLVTHVAAPESNPLGAQLLSSYVSQFNNTRYPWIVRSPGTTGSAQYDRTEYVNQVLLGSDTTVGMLVGIPYALGANGTGASGLAVISTEDLLAVESYLSASYPGRILMSCAVMPNDRIDVQLSMMEQRAGDCQAWFTNTAWGPGGGSLPDGYWLDEGVGPQMLQKGIDLGRPIFLVWKGMPLNSFSATYTDPVDVGPAARMFPETSIVVLHSAFEHGLGAGQSSEPTDPADGNVCSTTQRTGGLWPEGPYDEQDAGVQASYPLDRGVNSLIKSLRDANIGPNGHDLDDPTGPVTTHVYASLDGVWANLMTQRHDEAMHVIGKLLLHVGEDRILWGTESLWYGSPQPQIDGFRCFEISQEFQDTYGYPALTPAIKAKILGLNAAAMLSQLPDVSLP